MSARREVVLRNDGLGALTVRDLALQDNSSAAEFSLSIALGAEGQLDEIPNPLVLEAEQSATLIMTYSPADTEEDRGRVTLSTNDPDAREVEIPIRMLEQAGEIRVSPTLTSDAWRSWAPRRRN